MSHEPRTPGDENLDRLLSMSDSPPQLDADARARLLQRLQRSAAELHPPAAPSSAPGGPIPMSPRRVRVTTVASSALALAAAGAAAAMALLLALACASAGLAALLLTGVALGALCSALITVCQALAAHRWDFGLKVVYWLMGSFEARTWAHVLWAAPPIALGLALALWLRRDLDALHLGPEAAASLGVDLRRARAASILAVGLLVGAATALAGVIAFVGLVAPHLARMSTGPGHRRLVPLAAAIGASATIAVDALARAQDRVLVPPGVVTSLLGAPFFLWLLRRRGLRGLAG